ncbi:hypothetical protein [Persicobacter psychrovividus]|uniref:DUF4350 domain-containing protein n=1 Tax=Persicobacter psychrovividus TaxID=387638 RepID=A0ABN6L5N6_9BACT|nr:hypothetical protein PEPS_07500 [Persicobacter psychrovividus]
MAKRNWIWSLLLLLICHFGAMAQNVKLDGYFMQDSTKVGEDLAYILTAKYPETLNILFPDSLNNFHPFEYNRREVFPTKTTAGISTDSVVYHLSTFETDSLQTLVMPVYLIQEKDSLTLFAPASDIFFAPTVLQLPDSLKMRANVAYTPVDYPFNYPYWFAGLGIFLALLIIGFLIFGSGIRQQFKIKKLQRQHSKFLNNFDSLTSSNQQAELSAHWKSYVETIDGRPFSKLTTKEIAKVISDQEAVNALKLLDRNIYGAQSAEIEVSQYDHLRQFAIETFEEKLNKIKND